MQSRIRVLRLPHGDGLPLPHYQSALAAGLDLIAAVAADAPIVIAPGERALIPTGIAIALPPGYEAQVRPRSGLALRARRHRVEFTRNDRCGLSRRNTGHPCKSRTRNHSQSNAARALHSWSSPLQCKRRFARLQVWMKPHAEFGVLGLRGQFRGKENRNRSTRSVSSNILPSPVRPLGLTIRPQFLDAAIASQGHPCHCRSPRHRHEFSWQAGGGEIACEPASSSAAPSRTGFASARARRNPARRARTARRLRARAQRKRHRRRRDPARGRNRRRQQRRSDSPIRRCSRTSWCRRSRARRRHSRPRSRASRSPIWRSRRTRARSPAIDV